MSETLTPMAFALCKMLAITCTTSGMLYNAASDQPDGSPAKYDSMLTCPSGMDCHEIVHEDECVVIAVRRDERHGWSSVISLCRAKNHEGDEMEPDS